LHCATKVLEPAHTFGIGTGPDFPATAHKKEVKPSD
jgi:hypothetical protein